MGSENQARDARGRFAAGGHGAEAATRDAGRFPVEPHNDQKSVASHTGKLLSYGAPTPTPTKRLSTAAQERQAILRGVDQRYGRRNISH